LNYFHVDAFTSRPFGGNPAAVVPLARWLPDAVMQQIANELQLSETAFFVPDGDGFHLRWFTPAVEIDLCGHATLASAHVLFTELSPGRTNVRFASKSGPLEVRLSDGRLTLDFPSRPPRPVDDPGLAAQLTAALGRAPSALLRSRDLCAVYERPEEVRELAPDFGRLAAIESGEFHAVSVTAPGEGEVDFVSRFFAPREGIDEDPVTGSAHCHLIPYWAERLGKTELRARQVSRRGGELWCRLRGDRVDIAGDAVLVARGTLAL
jgi:PhzF family phenazine biosynthesis protein